MTGGIRTTTLTHPLEKRFSGPLVLTFAMVALLLVRYGELALKSPPVRREFESTLRRNILDQFVREGIPGRIRSDRGHFYVETDDAERGANLVRRVFGVTSVSRVDEVPSDPAAISTRLLELADARLRPGVSFAVRARRTGQHPFTSQQLAGDLGAAVLERFPDRGLTVDLERPDVELFVEVRGPRTYLSFDRSPGPGGLPLGVAGRLVALVDGSRGALGAFLMMKRGCRVALVVLPDGEPFVRETLARFDPTVRVAAAPVGAEAWAPVLATLAEDVHADGVVLPIVVEEYSRFWSQWGNRVLFSPTVGLSDEEVNDRWKGVVALVS
ncbi:MAG: THUMP domain-containing protein [Thermoplasmata archaeon]